MIKLVFLDSSKTPLGWFVRMFERGEYSHVELVFSDGMSYSCISDEGPKNFGVRARKVEYDGNWTTVEIHADQDAEAAIRAFCDGNIGKPYDYFSLLGYLFKGGKMYPHAYICSEFVLDALNYGGLFLEYKGQFHSPSKLYKLITDGATFVE